MAKVILTEKNEVIETKTGDVLGYVGSIGTGPFVTNVMGVATFESVSDAISAVIAHAGVDAS